MPSVSLLWICVISVLLDGVHSQYQYPNRRNHRPRFSRVRHLVSQGSDFPLLKELSPSNMKPRPLFNWEPEPKVLPTIIYENNYNEINPTLTTTTTPRSRSWSDFFPTTIRYKNDVISTTVSTTTSTAKVEKSKHNVSKPSRKGKGNKKKDKKGTRVQTVSKYGDELDQDESSSPDSSTENSIPHTNKGNRRHKKKQSQKRRNKGRKKDKKKDKKKDNKNPRLEVTTSTVESNRILEIYPTIASRFNYQENTSPSTSSTSEDINEENDVNINNINPNKHEDVSSTTKPVLTSTVATNYTNVGDLSCLQPFMLAPTVNDSHVKYKRKEFNTFTYMTAEYICNEGFTMASVHSRLICRHKKWIGVVPRCQLTVDVPILVPNIRPPCYDTRGKCDQLCNVENGKEVCTCYRGFKIDSNGCKDINECEYQNGGCDYNCVNTIGGHHCSCPSGMRVGDIKTTCDDINECLLNNGHGPCQDTCSNTWGSYTCSCGGSEGLKGTKLSADGHTCESVDACTSGASGCSHSCINAPGGRGTFCTCPEGWILGDDWKTCKDVDECADPDLQDPERLCPVGTCENFEGGYQCVEPIAINDEPPLSLPICASGTRLNVTTRDCEDIDECSKNNGGCHQQCINTAGSFHCACLSGYVFNKDKLTCIVGASHLACSALFPPKHGYLECLRPHNLVHHNPAASGRSWRYLRTRSGRRRITNRPGTLCTLRCPAGFKPVGAYQLTCQHDGAWQGDSGGQCVHMKF